MLLRGLFVFCAVVVGTAPVMALCGVLAILNGNPIGWVAFLCSLFNIATYIPLMLTTKSLLKHEPLYRQKAKGK